jgi:hypothetical protein
MWGQGIEEAAGMGAGSVVAAGDCGVRRRIDGEYRYDHVADDFLCVGGVHAFFHYYGSHFAMQCYGGWDRKL